MMWKSRCTRKLGYSDNPREIKMHIIVLVWRELTIFRDRCFAGFSVSIGFYRYFVIPKPKTTISPIPGSFSRNSPEFIFESYMIT